MPLDCYEYMRLPINIIPDEIILQCNLGPLVHNGYVYMQIWKGMYGLLQASILSNKLLTKWLAVHNFAPIAHTPSLWQHATWPITFTLVVDNFGIKYVGKQRANYLYQQGPV
jgi:hypothetical protein